MDLSITTRTEGNAYICTLDGGVDSLNADKLSGEARSAFLSGAKRLIFDLTQVDYVASAGLGMFVTAIKTFPGTVAFAGLQPYVRQTFTLNGFNKLAAVYTTLEEALKG
jgi:anti-sigma B factor antagonist